MFIITFPLNYASVQILKSEFVIIIIKGHILNYLDLLFHLNFEVSLRVEK